MDQQNETSCTTVVEEDFVTAWDRERGRYFIGGQLHERLSAAGQWLSANPHKGVRLSAGRKTIENQTLRIAEFVPYVALAWPEPRA